MMLGLEVTAEPHPDGVVLSTAQTFDGVRGWVSRELIRLKDNAVREALIKAGWTPPPEMAWK